MLTFDNPAILERVKEWTSEKYDEETRREVQALVDAGEGTELEDRFWRTLAFGTGGLRGKLGAGTNRMNSYIVARATQGLANYVKRHATKAGPLRAAVAHDSRHRSREFAETTAAVLAANGFYVHLSPELRPTPYLSFAMRQLGCHTGIVVTASHNPREYNGYKVYWDDGSQVVPPHDKGIIEEVGKIDDDTMVSRLPFDEGVSKGLIKILGGEMDHLYLDALRHQREDEERIRRHGPRIVFTPLHGVGGTMAPAALADWGFGDVICEPEQMKPDGDFPTAASPNPEEGAALDRAIRLAESQGADLVLATDPDADRLGIAVRHEGTFHLMSGNQVCALLADFVLRNPAKRTDKGYTPGIVTTIVTSPLVPKIATARGARCPLTLTGFKWIAAQIRAWEESGEAEFVYGTEESYGYLVGRHCRDKDGIVAACVVAELAAACRAEGMTLVDQMHRLYAEFGVHHEWQRSITMPGREGAERIRGILDRIRSNPPREVDGIEVARFTRVDTGEIFEKGRKVGTLGLPASDVFLFDLADGSKAVARPSGTEPKIKFYFFLESQPLADGEAVKEKLAAFRERAGGFESAFLKAIGYED